MGREVEEEGREKEVCIVSFSLRFKVCVRDTWQRRVDHHLIISLSREGRRETFESSERIKLHLSRYFLRGDVVHVIQKSASTRRFAIFSDGEKAEHFLEEF